MTEELHRLALDYRSAKVHTEVVAAWDALERYEAKLLARAPTGQSLIALAEECGAFRIIAGELAFDDAALADFAAAIAREQEAQPAVTVAMIEQMREHYEQALASGRTLAQVRASLEAAQPAAQEPKH